MEFIKENSILPSPFNIMPDTLTLTKFFKWFFACCFKIKNENNNASKSNSMIEMSQIKANGKSSALENGDLRKSNMVWVKLYYNKNFELLDYYLKNILEWSCKW